MCSATAARVGLESGAVFWFYVLLRGGGGGGRQRRRHGGAKRGARCGALCESSARL